MPMIRAASVPNTARNMESAKLAWKLSMVNTLRYHLSDSPCGGKASELPADIPAKMMMMKGPIRKVSVRPRMIHVGQRVVMVGLPLAPRRRNAFQQQIG
jgi:hypothetical protein